MTAFDTVRDWLGLISGYKKLYETEQDALIQCNKDSGSCNHKLRKAENRIDQLQRLVPRGEPPLKLYTVQKDTLWVQAQITSMNATLVRLNLGWECLLTDKDSFKGFVAYDWVDQYEYHKFYRCGNFAISFKAHADQWGVNQVGIVLDYAVRHVYNVVLFPDEEAMLLEPQNDVLFHDEERPVNRYNFHGSIIIM